ncbi:MAG TPA: hypothetical protein VFM41_01725 [Gaiella sp.]|nr:hypothetical protein [Gaiella sp.]
MKEQTARTSLGTRAIVVDELAFCGAPRHLDSRKEVEHEVLLSHMNRFKAKVYETIHPMQYG